MQIGIRLHDTKKGTLEERVAIAEEQGFSCAHLALKKVISEYSVADSALTPGFSCYLKKCYTTHVESVIKRAVHCGQQQCK